ncbi:MAG TPA: hypothetical protein VKP52_07525 [Pseudolabrys sp.]|nr:hypothetical protein [Pseudolabrys sp.]
MLLAGGLQSSSLNLPTLSLVAVCIAGLLGLFLIIDWLQQRNVRALPWWGSAYLIGASAMAMGTMPEPFIKLPAAVPSSPAAWSGMAYGYFRAVVFCRLRLSSALRFGSGSPKFRE